LVIEKSLYYDAWTEKHQITQEFISLLTENTLSALQTRAVLLFNALMAGHSEHIHRLQSALNVSTPLEHRRLSSLNL
jgi:hypothetical protein